MPIVVTHIIDNLKPGGAQNIILNIVRNSPDDIQHRLIALGNSTPEMRAQFESLAPVVTLHLSIRKCFYRFLQLWRTLSLEKPDVIVFHLQWAYLAMLFFSMFRPKLKKIIALHALPTQIHSFWFHLVVLVARWAEAITCEDQIVIDYLVKRGIKRKKLIHIPIGTEITETPRKKVLSHYPKSENQPMRFLNIGRMVPGKGQRLLIQAFHVYLQKGNVGRLDIVGYGPLETVLKQMVEELQLQDSVQFYNPTTEILPYYAGADVYVSSATDEPMGVVVVDAMMMGLPIVAFDLGSIREMVTPDKNGVLVSSVNVSSLGDAMGLLAKEPQWRKDMGQSNHQKIVDQGYQNETLCQKYYQLYRCGAL
jgi:glycosyltransferase involved in cell wall biosynthesis